MVANNIKMINIKQQWHYFITIYLYWFQIGNQSLENEFKLNDEEKSSDQFINFMTSKNDYEIIKRQLEIIKITTDLIENIELKDDNKFVKISKLAKNKE